MLNLVDLFPNKLILQLASPYLAGKDAQGALSLAKSFYHKQGFTSTIDVLGEAAASEEQCQKYMAIYLHVIDLISSMKSEMPDERARFTLSFKPSMLCASQNPDCLPDQANLEAGYQRMSAIVAHAFVNQVNMTLEAEQSIWTQYQLNSYFSLLDAGYTNLGTVLQSRLFRTAEDIKLFDNNKKARVRLVIGIYEESPDIAFTDKKLMKEKLIAYAKYLLSIGSYVEFATHDELYVEKFIQDVVQASGINTDKFEIQFLYGVPRSKLQRRLSDQGYLVRLYMPFGDDDSAGPYCKRRLKTNPNLFLYGLKNLFDHIR